MVPNLNVEVFWTPLVLLLEEKKWCNLFVLASYSDLALSVSTSLLIAGEGGRGAKLIILGFDLNTQHKYAWKCNVTLNQK